MKRLHLICNAHLDPVWMWEKDEGVAEVLSTYRTAADFCEDYPDFIFNHNESVLYQWVEEYDPELFARIQKLVRIGRWKIIGGFYLQPDCNMPFGEAMVRQALTGRQYFKEKFDAMPKTAINFDSFGHSRGLVQIFSKTGFESYIVCRPVQDHCPLPAEDFIWEGYDGSKILCHRGYNSYESHRGEADQKIEGYMTTYPDKEIGLVLWGIGDHGGGPSRIDYEKIEKLRQKTAGECELYHSYPERYFEELTEGKEELPTVAKPLHYHSVGCYTSQIRIKQEYRHLENMLLKVEKMMSCAALNGLCEYPRKELDQAWEDLLFTQFHDILPGTTIEVAEDAALRQLHHGTEIAERLKIKAFLLMLNGEPRAEDGVIPIFVFNPHPVTVHGIISCEFNLPDQNKDSSKWAFPRVYQDGKPIPCQVEHEASNFNVDWRKKVVFEADLKPFAMNRFECKVEFWENEPEKILKKVGKDLLFRTDDLEVLISGTTGAIESLMAGGREYLKGASFVPEVFEDDYDSWGNNVKGFERKEGTFRLMEKHRGSLFSGITNGQDVESLRVIEDGDIRTVVEAVMEYGDTTLCLHYYLPKHGSEIQVELLMNCAEKMKMIKMPIFPSFQEANYLGQVMYGRDELPMDGMEAVAQRYTALVSEKEDKAVTVINQGNYGSDCRDGIMRISLLRTPGYSAGCSDFSRRKPEVMEQERYNHFVDQGIRKFSFWIDFGKVEEKMKSIDTRAAIHNEEPFALSCFPGGEGKTVLPLIRLDQDSVQLTAFKKAAGTENYVIRLFEPTGREQTCTVEMPIKGLEKTVSLKPFEIKTLVYDIQSQEIREENLLEGEGLIEM
ncbi:MAG TPA: alpha-mannosidase [Candidatus Limivivens merdigallinarum]|uniref:Alpha-mannosidase n=1 Tax=Candidatus Limivivens merdigallinarum TaxID=2840859 RepID=A0A9D1D0Q4_9FIRM|nr:alpha-mannosidase [Candidatus Limivivens merdigallinarum]